MRMQPCMYPCCALLDDRIAQCIVVYWLAILRPPNSSAVADKSILNRCCVGALQEFFSEMKDVDRDNEVSR